MAEQQEKVFAEGFIFKQKENDPDWVLGHLSLKADEAIAFVKKHTKESGWCNLDVKIGKSGKIYVELDTWEPKPQGEEKSAPAKAAAAPAGDVEGEDLPF